MTVNDIAKEYGVTRAAVSRWLREGLLKGFKIGSQWRVKREDLNAFLERLNQ